MSRDSGDRPTTTDEEIEITPEMLEAGYLEFLDSDSRFMRRRSIVAAIYEAMERARRAAAVVPESGSTANPESV